MKTDHVHSLVFVLQHSVRLGGCAYHWRSDVLCREDKCRLRNANGTCILYFLSGNHLYESQGCTRRRVLPACFTRPSSGLGRNNARMRTRDLLIEVLAADKKGETATTPFAMGIARFIRRCL